MSKRLGLGGLWRSPDFMKMWAGETISFFGQQVAFLALPLAAALTLNATPAQMGILGAAKFLPFIFVTLFAGVWIDRQRRRPILILSNLARAGFLVLIPLFAALGTLRMVHLYVVAFLVGIFQVVFELAYQSYLPSLVERENLVEGNSKLGATWSAAEIGGPGLGGILVELVGAPMAILSNTFGFLISALTLGLIRKPEPRPSPPEVQVNLGRQIAEGFRIVMGNAYLRALAGQGAFFNLFYQVIMTVFILYATGPLGMGAGVLGWVMATGSIGALLGSMGAGYIAARIGVGRTVLGAMAVAAALTLLLPVASGTTIMPKLLLVAAFAGSGFGQAVTNVEVVSLRQTITPNRLLGRMNASYRFVVYGFIPLGSLIGGALGELLGLRMTLLIGAIGLVAALLWIVFSPVPRLFRLPVSADEQEAQAAGGQGAGPSACAPA